MGAERQRAEEFTRRLREAYGEDLVAVVLYGSAARGEYREGVSNLNLLVIVRSTEAAALRRGSSLAREWVEAGNPPPLVLSETEWRQSADVFPIEYSDIQDASVVLHGGDPFAGVSIDWDHLRLQCEHEIKSKQIQLREHYLLTADRAEELGQLLVQSFSTFLTLFRAGLRLAGEPVPREAREVVEAVSRRAGFDPAAFLEVLRAREQRARLAPAGDDPTVVGYLDAVARATRWVDQLSRPATGS